MKAWCHIFVPREEKVNNSTALMDIPDDDHETKLVQKKQRYSDQAERWDGG